MIDNSLDAAIGDQSLGRLLVYPDVHTMQNRTVKTTGLCIVNNCINEVRPLKQVLEPYDSSKVNSGAKEIGENGVGKSFFPIISEAFDDGLSCALFLYPLA